MNVINKKKFHKYFLIMKYNLCRVKQKAKRHLNKHRIMRSIIKTRYSKKKLNAVFLVVITQLIILHLNFLLCAIISLNIWYLDFLIHIFISVCLHFFYYHIYHMVNLYRPQFYKLIRYIINNYSEDNFRIWKIKFVIGLTLYLLVALSLIELNKKVIIVQLFENIISCVIIDLIEEETVTIMIQKPEREFVLVKEDHFD